MINIFQSWPHYLRLMRVHRPIGFLLLLWPTLWALWLAAQGMPPVRVLVIFVLGVFVMRCAGCVANDLADRHYDRQVERTQSRPLAAGIIRVRAAKILLLILLMLAASLLLFLHGWTIVLALMALLLALLYPFAKRVMALPQLVLGVAFAWGIPMAFAQIVGHVPIVAWLLFLATFFWIVAYDTEYAMADRLDDSKIGVYSSALYFARYVRVWIALFQLAMLVTLACLGWQLLLNRFFYLMLLAASGFMLYQHYLLAQSNPDYMRVFANNNWVGAIIFLGIAQSLT